MFSVAFLQILEREKTDFFLPTQVVHILSHSLSLSLSLSLSGIRFPIKFHSPKRQAFPLSSFVVTEMASDFGESTSVPPQSVSCSGNNANDVGDFECNICFELAQDPIITRCGHLFCWPCLYRWLHHHSNSQECPFCKALVEEEKLVPLYGRGKTQTDSRSKSYPGINIPNRPSGQRPPTAPPPDTNQFANYGFGFMGGFVPMATQRIGNFTLATAFGGLLPSLLNVQYHGFPDATVYGTTSGFPFASFNSFHGGHGHGFFQPENHQRQPADVWKYFFLFIGVFVIVAIIFGS